MKKRLWILLATITRQAALALVAVSLIAAMAFPSVTVRVPVGRVDEPTTVSDQKQLSPGIPDADESTGKMGTGRKQQAAPLLVMVPPVLQKADDGLQRRSVIADDEAVLIHARFEIPSFTHSVSLPNVSTQAARQFTLVGAKPSGTM